MSAPARIGDSAQVVPEADARQEHGKVTSSYSIFLIVVAIVFLAIAVVFAINTYFYDRIRSTGCSTSISKNEAEALFWTNLVLAIVAGIMFIVSIILIFTETKAPTYANKYLGKLRYEGEVRARAAAAGARPYVSGAAAGLGQAAIGFNRAVGATAATARDRILDEGAQVLRAGQAAFTRANIPADPRVTGIDGI